MSINELWPRAILHIDMDAFFASVEQRDNPEFLGKPLIVGGYSPNRGVVSAASYEARSYGISSAMPMYQALRLCPHVIRVGGRKDVYRAVSRDIYNIFLRFTPLVQMLSLDEAFLDITGSQLLYGFPESIGFAIKKAIKSELDLTASAGLADNKFVAKIASSYQKPDGFTVVRSHSKLSFLSDLPINKLWGVGDVLESKFKRLGVFKIGNLLSWSRDDLIKCFGSYGDTLYSLVRGVDDTAVIPNEVEKSFSHETTFLDDIIAVSRLQSELLELSELIGRRLKEKKYFAKVIYIKIRYNDFTTITRQKSLKTPTNLVAVIYATACELLLSRTGVGTRPVRLLGLGVTKLSSMNFQGSLFSDFSNDLEKLSRLEFATLLIQNKLGSNSLKRGSLYFKDMLN